MKDNLVAIIGGSGINDSPIFKGSKWEFVDTQYRTGKKFSGMQRGVVEYQSDDEGLVFIPRHHGSDPSKRFGPSRTQYAENMIAAKMLGCKVVVGVSAVGSLKEHIHVGSLVIPDDYIDESGRNDNLFGEGAVVHANPIPAFSEQLREILIDEAYNYRNVFGEAHDSGVYVVIPGDRFGTKAEGMRRAQYADIVGMTLMPEASMAMQLGMHYASISIPVDVNLDANHEGKTLAVMKELSAPDKLPAYITSLVGPLKEFALHAGPLEQLKGNVIPGDLGSISNQIMKNIAQEIINTYCR